MACRAADLTYVGDATLPVLLLLSICMGNGNYSCLERNLTIRRPSLLDSFTAFVLFAFPLSFRFVASRQARMSANARV